MIKNNEQKANDVGRILDFVLVNNKNEEIKINVTFPYELNKRSIINLCPFIKEAFADWCDSEKNIRENETIAKEN